MQDSIESDALADALAAEAEQVRCAQQDRAAFGVLYDRYIDAVYRFAYQHTGEHAAAQDVTAETFRRALEGLARYEWQGKPFGAWLLRIAHFVLLERARTQQHLPDGYDALAEDVHADDTPAVVDDLIAREERAILWELVSTLPVAQQRILVWRYAREWDYATIAAQLGRTPAAAKQLAYRALQAVRKQVIASGMWSEREHSI